MLRMFTIVLHLVCVILCLQLQQGVSGHQCLEHPPNLNATSGAGTVTEVGGLKAYVTGPSNSELAIILASDVYGFEAPNLRKIADKVASNAGFNVVVPDFFYGDPYNPNNTQRNMTDWLRDHGTDKGFEDAKRVIAALKNKGVSGIGAAGFCWGGKVVAELSKGYYTDAAVLLHPSRVSLDDIEEIKTPIAILAAQFDNGTPPELMKQFKEILSTNKVDNFVKIFPGVSHGWTVRYKDDNVTAVKSANEAHQDMLDWFITTKIADKVASKAGFNVVVPDFFYGDPYNPNNTQRNMTDWLREHGTDKGFEDAKRVIAALKNKGVSGIGAAGFCWGGKVVAELSKGYYTEAAVLLHPSRVTLDDIKEIKTPIAILAAQFDNGTAPELMNQFKEILSTNKVDNFVKIFPGVSHGWTVRSKDDNVTPVKSGNKAHQDMLDWFITTYVQKT